MFPAAVFKSIGCWRERPSGQFDFPFKSKPESVHACNGFCLFSIRFNNLIETKLKSVVFETFYSCARNAVFSAKTGYRIAK